MYISDTQPSSTPIRLTEFSQGGQAVFTAAGIGHLQKGPSFIQVI
ncbi:hypothetical protein [Limnohabitans sp. Rim8]